jgi:hypothetical protein
MKKILILAIGLLSSTFLKAQVPMLLEYDGYLIERGKPVTGNRTIGVKVYNSSKSGSVLYNETIGTVTISQGEFYFQYGQNGTTQNGNLKGISGALSGSQLWLALTVNGTEQTPRQRLLAVPFALRSADAQKTDADLRKMVDAVGRVMVAFGGNSSNLLSNPAETVASLEKNVKDLLEVRSRFRVLSLSGNMSFGSTGNPKQLTIQNNGFDTLSVNSIVYPLGFSGNWSSGKIPVGGSQVVSIEFKAKKIGNHGGSIRVISDATSGNFTVACSGIGYAKAIDLNFHQSGNDLIDMDLRIGRTFRIINTGLSLINVSKINYPNGFSGDWNGGSISAGGFKDVVVSLTGQPGDYYSGNITIISDASVGPNTFTVEGEIPNDYDYYDDWDGMPDEEWF